MSCFLENDRVRLIDMMFVFIFTPGKKDKRLGPSLIQLNKKNNTGLLLWPRGHLGGLCPVLVGCCHKILH